MMLSIATKSPRSRKARYAVVFVTAEVRAKSKDGERAIIYFVPRDDRERAAAEDGHLDVRDSSIADLVISLEDLRALLAHAEAQRPAPEPVAVHS